MCKIHESLYETAYGLLHEALKIADDDTIKEKIIKTLDELDYFYSSLFGN